MSWLDTLLDRGNETKGRAEPPPAAVTPAKPRRAPLEIKLVWFQTAAPHNRNQGAVEAAYYSVANGMLTICDQNGRPTGNEYVLVSGADARRVAGRLAREAWVKATGTSDFNRPLHFA